MVVNAFYLCETIGYQSSFISLNVAIYVLFGLIDPFSAYNFNSFW